MDIELFCICDAATITGNRLSVISIFDAISLPAGCTTGPRMAIALRVRMELSEPDSVAFQVGVTGPDGEDIWSSPCYNASPHCDHVSAERFFNAVLNIDRGLTLPYEGTYEVRLHIDRQLARSIRLLVVNQETLNPA